MSRARNPSPSRVALRYPEYLLRAFLPWPFGPRPPRKLDPTPQAGYNGGAERRCILTSRKEVLTLTEL